MQFVLDPTKSHKIPIVQLFDRIGGFCAERWGTTQTRANRANSPLPSSSSPTAAMSTLTTSGLLVQIASYNTNLQGNLGLPQDLVDWLAPTLSSSQKALDRSPDIVAVGFQELLPLHLGCAFVL